MSNEVTKVVIATPQGDAGDLYHDSGYVFNCTGSQPSHEASLLMPNRPRSYAFDRLPAAFAMNMPEGALLSRLQKKHAKTGGLNDMQLLAMSSSEQIGRLRYRLPGAPEGNSQVLHASLCELLQTPSSTGLFEHLLNEQIDHGSPGISGLQPKVLVRNSDGAGTYPLQSTNAPLPPSHLIVKASDESRPCLAQNEFLCMEVARLAGICVPRFWLSDDRKLFVIERFDRPNGQAIGFEDMSTLTCRTPNADGSYKYQGSYEGIALAIRALCAENGLEGTQRLFEYVALSVMVRNGDAHLKNFGLLYDTPSADRAPALAPPYDVATTTSYSHHNKRTGVTMVDDTLALSLNKTKAYPTRQALETFGSAVCCVARPGQVIERIADAMTAVLSGHHGQIESALLQKLSVEWNAGRMAVSKRLRQRVH